MLKAKKPKFLTEEQRVFIKHYIKSTNASDAFRKMCAELDRPLPKRYASTAREWLNRPEVMREIELCMAEVNRRARNASVMTGEEVMEFFTKVVRGEVKDQFGLDAPLSERTKAAMEIAKRTVDLENRLNGVADNVTKVTIDWGRKK